MEISLSLDPSLPDDLENYLAEINAITGVSFHCDVMDGKLVERSSLTPEQYEFVLARALNPVDVHLMIINPHKNIDAYLNVSTKPRTLVFQVESLSAFEAKRLLRKIKGAGIRCGIAIDLNTHVGDSSTELAKIIEQCDCVVLMSVKAGRSGQVFNQSGLIKVARVKKINPAVRVILDGGINHDNIALVKKAGVSTAVIGSAIYKAPNRKAAADSFRQY